MPDVETLVAGIREGRRAAVSQAITLVESTSRKHREQARELAVRAAREKADKMAAALGERVGRARQVGEQSYNDGGTTYRSGWSGWNAWSTGRDRSMSQVSVGVDSSELTETLALGTIGIRARVSVQFDLEPGR